MSLAYKKVQQLLLIGPQQKQTIGYLRVKWPNTQIITQIDSTMHYRHLFSYHAIHCQCKQLSYLGLFWLQTAKVQHLYKVTPPFTRPSTASLLCIVRCISPLTKTRTVHCVLADCQHAWCALIKTQQPDNWGRVSAVIRFIRYKPCLHLRTELVKTSVCQNFVEMFAIALSTKIIDPLGFNLGMGTILYLFWLENTFIKGLIITKWTWITPWHGNWN